VTTDQSAGTLAAGGASDTRLTEARAVVEDVARSVERVISGKPEAIRLSLVALLAEGHLLIEDVPGVGKTMLAKALARSIDCSMRRIQFTPDLLPGDVTARGRSSRTSSSATRSTAPHRRRSRRCWRPWRSSRSRSTVGRTRCPSRSW
jgi:MoxR-like ATPase